MTSNPDNPANSPSAPSFSQPGHEVAVNGTEAVPSFEGYKLLERIGHGGMGIVWRTIQLSTGQQVALKLLPAAALGSDRARARFEAEIHWAAKLQHPNIARVYDSGLLHGSYFYAMELIDGVHLDEYVQQQRLSPRQVLGLIAAIARAVHHAHERGVIHRDLKPSNIIVAPGGRPIIVDFGLARAASLPPTVSLASSAPLAGTPAYMAPEQAQGLDERIGRQTDVYALGVVLYRFLTGRFPHDLTKTRLKMMERIAHEPIRPPRQINTGLSRDLDAVLLRCLAAESKDRYVDAGHLADDIDRLLEGRPVQARPVGTSGRIWLWCCHRDRILQTGNLILVLAAFFLTFHLVLGITINLSPPPGLRRTGFALCLAGFWGLDAMVFLGGWGIRRNRAWAMWMCLGITATALTWFALVMAGVIHFTTFGVVPNHAVRTPIYTIFSSLTIIAAVGMILALLAHYANKPMDTAIRQYAPKAILLD